MGAEKSPTWSVNFRFTIDFFIPVQAARIDSIGTGLNPAHGGFSIFNLGSVFSMF